MWQGVDKRRFPRVHYPCKVIVVKGGQRETFLTRTENIGAGGVCVVLKKGLDKFCPVEITLYLENGHSPIECDGRVVWTVKRHTQFDTGIEFININPGDASRIEKVVQECLRNKSSSAQEE